MESVWLGIFSMKIDIFPFVFLFASPYSVSRERIVFME